MSDFIYQVRLKEADQRAAATHFFGGVSFVAGCGTTPHWEDVARLIFSCGCEITNDLPLDDGARLYEALVKLGMSAEDARLITVGE